MPRSVGQDAGLRFDELRGEHPLHRTQQGIPTDQLQVAASVARRRRSRRGASPRPRHSPRPRRGTAGRPVRWRWGTPRCTSDQPGARRLGMLGQQSLEVGLHPVLLQAGVDARDRELESSRISATLICSVSPSRPRTSHNATSGSSSASDRATRRPVLALVLHQRARRAHPVQRLVGPVVGVDRHGSVRLDQDEPGGHRQVGRQTPRVVDLTAGNHQSHRVNPSCGSLGPAVSWSGKLDSRGPPTEQAPAPPRPLGSGHATSAEKRDGRWIVRSVSGAAASKAYRCPGCSQLIAAAHSTPCHLARRPSPARRPAASRSVDTGMPPAGSGGRDRHATTPGRGRRARDLHQRIGRPGPPRSSSCTACSGRAGTGPAWPKP